MKMILKIARMELQKMFYSPIAWLILIIFAVQSGIIFMDYIKNLTTSAELGYNLSTITARMFRGSFAQVQRNIYLYIPLLTMGLLSKEFGSGSIKLLYSSPISNKQIILGKFVSMMVFGLAMILILFLGCFYGFWAIKDYDFPLVATGLLGLYLLICTYSAIGLFMSSLTSYQVVAAMGTFATFFVMQQVGKMWQGLELVRDITYWLSISGRSETFINGLICSEDLLYFILVSGLFITFTIFRLKGIREKSLRYISFTRYAGAFMVVALIGYVSTIPSLMKYYDSTRCKDNTLTPNSQEVISKLKGKIKITTYVNIFGSSSFHGMPRSINRDLDRYKQYRRFKPDIVMKYKYYYDLPVQKEMLESHNKRFAGMSIEEALTKVCNTYDVNEDRFKPGKDYAQEMPLKSELNRFVRKIETQDGKVSYLRIYDDMFKFPNESQRTAAFKKLVEELPLVGFVTGHKERDVDNFGSRGYFSLAKEKPFRWSLINNGFDFTACELSTPIDKNIDILVIVEAKTVFLDQEMKNLNDYIDRGGNLIIACDRKRQNNMNPLVERFGVKFLPGQVVEYNQGYTMDLVTSVFTEEGKKIAYQFERMTQGKGCVTMQGTVAISYEEGNEFKYTPVMISDSIVNLPRITDATQLAELKKAYAQKGKELIAEQSKMNKIMALINEEENPEDKGEYKGSWNELQTKDFIDEVAMYNPEKGELGGPITIVLALTRNVGSKEQRIMILGDADCFSNGELSRRRKGINASNFNMASGMFFWLSGNEVPVDVRRPEQPDNKIYTKDSGIPFLNVLYKIIIPALLALACLLIWLRRKGR